MEIERLGENQIKIILDKFDLKQRDIKIGELAYGSEKTQELFREMMMQALIECDFQTENTPLMVEAIPMSTESVTIIVTKVSSPDDIENKFNAINKQKEFSKKVQRKSNHNKNTSTEKTRKAYLNSKKNRILIFSFENLDLLTNLSLRISDIFEGISSIYKYKNAFYLVLENIDKSPLSTEHFEAILSEYGHKHVATLISKQFLIEHGEKFISEDAVSILSKYLG